VKTSSPPRITFLIQRRLGLLDECLDRHGARADFVYPRRHRQCLQGRLTYWQLSILRKMAIVLS
jgi:hypothetical protein